MTRRQLLTTLVTVFTTAGCALKVRASSPTPTGIVCGHVFGSGMRFGKITEENLSGRYPTRFVVPGAYLLIKRLPVTGPRVYQLVDKLFTDNYGYFEMELPPGHYVVKYPSTDPIGSAGIRFFEIEVGKVTLLGLS